MRTISALALLFPAGWAQAHGGHGLDQAHVHGWDLLGLVLAGLALALLISRRR